MHYEETFKGFFDHYEILSSKLYDEPVMLKPVLPNRKPSYIRTSSISTRNSPELVMIKSKRMDRISCTPSSKSYRIIKSPLNEDATQNQNDTSSKSVPRMSLLSSSNTQHWRPANVQKAPPNRSVAQDTKLQVGNKNILFQVSDKLATSHRHQMNTRSFMLKNQLCDNSGFGMSNMRLSGCSTADGSSTLSLSKKESPVSKCTSPPLARSHVALQSIKMTARQQAKKTRLVRTIPTSVASTPMLKCTPKPRSQSVQPLGSIQKKNERLHCECDLCDQRRIQRSLASSRSRIRKPDDYAYRDPLIGCSNHFFERVKMLKQYDLETAKQEQYELKKKKKKKQI